MMLKNVYSVVWPTDNPTYTLQFQNVSRKIISSNQESMWNYYERYIIRSVIKAIESILESIKQDRMETLNKVKDTEGKNN